MILMFISFSSSQTFSLSCLSSSSYCMVRDHASPCSHATKTESKKESKTCVKYCYIFILYICAASWWLNRLTEIQEQKYWSVVEQLQGTQSTNWKSTHLVSLLLYIWLFGSAKYCQTFNHLVLLLTEFFAPNLVLRLNESWRPCQSPQSSERPKQWKVTSHTHQVNFDQGREVYCSMG